MGKGFAKNMILHAEVDQSLHELITLFVTWCKKMSLDSCASFLEFQLEFTSVSADSLERSFTNCLRRVDNKKSRRYSFSFGRRRFFGSEHAEASLD
jgi:hypothetical protein